MSKAVPTPAFTQDTLAPNAVTIATLVEVFSAIQGEGVNVGTRQIFIRFGGCDLRCHFCDSAHTWRPNAICRIEQTPGLRDFVTYSNPVSQSQLLTWIAQQHQPHLHDSISLTGGEPLLQADFLRFFLPQVREAIHLPIYLETGGHRPQELQTLLPYLDLVGMDLKLPSISGETHWPEHTQCLKLCQQANVDVFCKVIVAQHTDPADLQQVRQTIATISPKIPVYLQPVTPLPQSTMQAPTPAQVLQWQADLKQTLQTVRVVPQTHKMLDQL